MGPLSHDNVYCHIIGAVMAHEVRANVNILYNLTHLDFLSGGHTPTWRSHVVPVLSKHLLILSVFVFIKRAFF